MKLSIRPFYYLLVLLLFSTSCATICYKKDCKVNFVSKNKGTKIRYNDSLYDLPVTIKRPRSKRPFSIVAVNDTVEKQFSVHASPAPGFLGGNMVFIYFAPLGWATDLTNPKRFYYGSTTTINLKDTTGIIRTGVYSRLHNYFARKYPVSKGAIQLSISLPIVNNFYFRPDAEPVKSLTGCLGLQGGLNYYYKRNRSIGLSAGTVLDFPEPFPSISDHFGGEYEQLSAIYVNLTNDYKIGRLSLGYGVNYAQNIWKRSSSDNTNNRSITKTNYTLGAIVKGHWQLGKNFYVGAFYIPSMLSLGSKIDMKYECLLSFDMMMKIGLKK